MLTVDSLRSSARDAAAAGGDHSSGGSPQDPGARQHNQRTRQRLWKQLTGSPLRKAFTALFTAAFTAAVTALVTAVVSGWFSGPPANTAGATQPATGPIMQSGSLGCPTAPPYPPLLASVHHETSLDIQGLEAVFPGKLNLSNADLGLIYKEGTVWS